MQRVEKLMFHNKKQKKFCHGHRWVDVGGDIKKNSELGTSGIFSFFQ